MTAPRPISSTVARTVLEDLRELVDALDRRVPHLDRKGEHDIARDAAALRAEAMKRIHEIEEGVRVTVIASVVQDQAEE
jgi:hypothetical protein